jgi:uncharacterized protein
MIEIVQRESIYLWYYFSIQAELIVPYWLTGILLGSLISVFAKERIHGLFLRMQGRHWGLFGLVPASLLGIVSPLCMYGTIPIAASFSEKGMRDDWLAAFMMSSILLNPQLLIYSTALGETALAVRFVSCFLCGIVAGLCVRVFYRNRKFFDFSGLSESSSRDIDPHMTFRLLKNIWRNIKATGPYFLVGVALTALYQRYVPTNLVASLFGHQRGFGVLMAATLGVPLYVCGGGTIPLLVEWLENGMSMGSAAAFMITGPTTKITNLGAVKIILGTKRFILYLAYITLFTCIAGALIDILGITP